MTGDQLLGWAAIIGALGVISGQIVQLVLTFRTKAKVEEVHAQVEPKNGATLADIIEANDLTGISNATAPDAAPGELPERIRARLPNNVDPPKGTS